MRLYRQCTAARLAELLPAAGYDAVHVRAYVLEPELASGCYSVQFTSARFHAIKICFIYRAEDEGALLNAAHCLTSDQLRQ